MDWLIPNILYDLAVPLLCYGFLCRYARIRGKLWVSAGYLLLFYALQLYGYRFQLGAVIRLPLELSALALSGICTAPKQYIKSVTFSALILSVFQVCHGSLFFLTYYTVDRLFPRCAIVLKYMDLLMWVVLVVCLYLLLRRIEHDLIPYIPEAEHLPLLILLVPVLFLTLTEKLLEEKTYGSTMVWDSEAGLVFPVVDHLESFCFQLLAGVCLFAVLAAFRRILKTMQDAQTIQMLEQQTRLQHIYVEEARLRDAQTRAFRHDIRNHLRVLGGFLREGQTERACQYLANLEDTAETLCYPVHTNNAAADVLLGSKLAAAEQQGVQVECILDLPAHTAVSDLDWCILLSNAVDNAVFASAQMPADLRMLTISGKRKGNFYLMQIQNTCALADGAIPREGIGISNMRTVVHKYGGTLGIAVRDGRFYLEILLLISQQ